MATIFQDRRTGKRVTAVGGSASEDLMLVKGNDGVPYYALASQLMPCDEQGTPDFNATAAAEESDEGDDVIPTPPVNLTETRLNVNVTTAEELAKRVPGITYRTAKEIKKIQTSQPGEVFRTLDQLKPASSRANWEEIFKANLIYVG